MALLTPADAIVAPRCLIRGDDAAWNLTGGTMSPGQTASGAFPFAAFPGGGLWQASLSQVNLLGEDAILAFRGLRTQAKQGIMPVVVFRNDGMLAPWPIVNGQRLTSYGSIPHSDETFFSDGSGYTQPVISATVVENAEINATSLTVRFLFGGPLRGGESFSLYHPDQGWRLYEIGSVEINDDGDSVVSLSPWLRDDIAAGEPVEFDAPRCTMRMADPSAMNLSLPNYKLARPDAAFVEYFFTV